MAETIDGKFDSGFRVRDFGIARCNHLGADDVVG